MTKYLAIIISLFGLYFASETSWFSYNKTWQEAAGVNLLNPTDKVLINSNIEQNPKIYWLGHAGIFLNINNSNILFDPNLSNTCKLLHRESKVFIEPEELPEIDAVILSHMHYDHYDIPTLRRIKSIKRIILPAGSEEYLPNDIKLKSEIIPINLNSKFTFNEIDVNSVPTLHNGARNHPFKSERFALGYVIKFKTDSIYFAGDTGFGDHFEFIRDNFHPNISILPIGAFEPYFILHKYHMSPEDAIKAAVKLKSELIIPIHFGTYRIALDGPSENLPDFAKLAREFEVKWRLDIIPNHNAG